MKLHLLKPLAFIDLETTGVEVTKDRIVQIAVLKVFPDGREELKSQIINPTIPIPPTVSVVHGIYDDDVKDAPTFAEVALDYLNFLDDSDLGGFNSNKFDIPLLVEEFLRVGICFKLPGRNLVDVQTIFHTMERRNLRAAYKFYCGQDLVGAHDAAVDIRATYEVLKAQIQRYENVEYSNDGSPVPVPIKNDINILSQLTTFNFLDPTGKLIYDEQKKAILFNFGKYKGKPLLEVFSKDPSYYDWMMNKGDFSLSTRKVLKRAWKAIHDS
ncbi:3'-5' exonuclease [Anabaena sphaerica FACHB-251]|uniref:3'-5' exonuclease n=1 Tax=Anabaena sphaerica FACHB-251 TaxID=2692883 RepID=A0A926WF53_9NOST|nr:3'-5' exonuclease [Anabaena sphaerica]MBD2293409.1 3'-5' exonuclease [Anabaena sphaerica FACHB-251]